MLTGRLPFSGDSAVAVAMKHVTEQPPAPRRLNPAIPAGLEALILRALAKDPAQRPQDAQEFARLLAAYEQLSQQETVFNASLPAAGPQDEAKPLRASPRVVAPPPRPQAGATGRVPVAAPRSTAPRAPRQEGLGCGVFLVGMLVLAGVLGLVFFVSSGALGSLFAGFGGRGGAGNGGVAPTALPSVTVEVGEPTPTPVPGVAVPDLTGFTESAADAALRQSQLVPVRLARNDPLIELSQVISQDVPPGTMLLPGQPVTYTVSLGPTLVTVPDVTGVNADFAGSQLAAAGLLVELLEQPSQSITAGFVIRQSPSPGLRIAQGQAVQIVVSQGDVVRFPDVIGLQREAAVQILNDTQGLELIFVHEQGRDNLGGDYDRYAVGEVVSAQIENGRGLTNGEFIARGSRIIIGVKRAE
jgi:beta-lactam-binding protein with PASTA domain